MRSRPFLIRLVFASVGMAVLGMGVYVAMGYAVRERFPWLVKVLGEERVSALQASYLRALGGLMPDDNDGDFFPDSVELYAGSKPNAPLDRPSTMVINHDWAVAALEGGLDVGRIFQGDPLFVCHPGERRRIRARVVLENGQRATFSPGMQLRLTGGLAPPALPESVPVATDGWVEFDLTISEDIVAYESAGIRPTKGVRLVDPVTKMEFGHFYVDLVWRQPPIPCAVDENPTGDEVSDERSINPDKTLHFARITWVPPPVGTADVVYVEAAPGDTGGDESRLEWFPVAFLRPDFSSWLLTHRPLAYLRSSRPGALKFRVVPAKWARKER